MGVGVCVPQREKKQQSLSDVSEEMYNRVIWWLEGLCFSLLWVRCGGFGRKEDRWEGCLDVSPELVY